MREAGRAVTPGVPVRPTGGPTSGMIGLRLRAAGRSPGPGLFWLVIRAAWRRPAPLKLSEVRSCRFMAAGFCQSRDVKTICPPGRLLGCFFSQNIFFFLLLLALLLQLLPEHSLVLLGILLFLFFLIAPARWTSSLLGIEIIPRILLLTPLRQVSPTPKGALARAHKDLPRGCSQQLCPSALAFLTSSLGIHPGDQLLPRDGRERGDISQIVAGETSQTIVLGKIGQG